MGCNCKVSQKIDYIHKKYGDTLPEKKKTNIRGSVIAHIENFLIYVAMIPLMPFFGLYVLFNHTTGKPIHIDKIVKRV